MYPEGVLNIPSRWYPHLGQKALNLNIIADPHWHIKKPILQKNWERYLKEEHDGNPVIFLGDMSWKGHSNWERIPYVQKRLKQLHEPSLFIPGNHDIGNPLFYPKGSQSLNPAKLELFQRTFGADYWAMSFGEWNLIGLNSEILGSNWPQEKTMLDKLEPFFQGNRLVIFSHRPWFVLDRRDTLPHYKPCLPPEIRKKLLKRLGGKKEVLILTGHRHAYKEIREKKIRHLWIPSLGLVNNAPEREHYKAKPQPGFFRIRLGVKGSVDYQFEIRKDWERVRK